MAALQEQLERARAAADERAEAAQAAARASKDAFDRQIHALRQEMVASAQAAAVGGEAQVRGWPAWRHPSSLTSRHTNPLLPLAEAQVRTDEAVAQALQVRPIYSLSSPLSSPYLMAQALQVCAAFL